LRLMTGQLGAATCLFEVLIRLAKSSWSLLASGARLEARDSSWGQDEKSKH